MLEKIKSFFSILPQKAKNVFRTAKEKFVSVKNNFVQKKSSANYAEDFDSETAAENLNAENTVAENTSENFDTGNVTAENFAENAETKNPAEDFVLENSDSENFNAEDFNTETINKENISEKNKASQNEEFGKENFYFRKVNSETKRSAEKNTSADSQKKSSSKTAQTEVSPVSPFAHFCDIIASLCFFAAVVVALKPELMSSMALNYYLKSTSLAEILKQIICLDFSFIKQIEENLLLLRNLFIVIAIGSFVLLKLITVLATISQKRIVSVLLLVISVLACVFVKEHFLLFLAFIILLYFAFEFSCGVRRRTVFQKIIILIILFVIEYFLLHFILLDGLLDFFAIEGIHW